MKNKSNRLPPSREVEWILAFATKLAHDRRSAVEVCDLLAAMYLSAIERLARYWEEWERLEDFVASECDIYQPRFMYLFEMYEHLHSDPGDSLTNLGGEVSVIIADASNVATENGWDEIKLEHILWSLTAEGRTKRCQGFVASGMKIDLVRKRMQRST